METYSARPQHLYTLSLPLLLLGTVVLGASETTPWLLFGGCVFGLGILIAIWIALSGALREINTHLETKADNLKSIAHDMLIMSKVRDPNIWAAMGYKLPPSEPPKIVGIEDTGDKARLPTLSYPTPPVSLLKMKMFANKVLMGGGMGEGEWSGREKVFTNPEYRALKKWMEVAPQLFIRLLNPSFPKQGFVLTKRGTEFLLTYADNEIRTLFEQKGRGEMRRELPADSSSAPTLTD